MSVLSVTITFPNSNKPPVSILPTASLFIALTLENSPILFACRTGICGTCLVRATGDMAPPTAEEQEVLELLAPNSPNARLACQIQPTGDLSLSPLKS